LKVNEMTIETSEKMLFQALIGSGYCYDIINLDLKRR